MPSAVSIANMALDLIGATPIMALTEDNPRAQICNRNYAEVLREVEEASNWNFLKRGGTLALVSPQPDELFGWDYVYGLPVGILRVIKVNGDLFTGEPSELWEIQNNRLYADADTVALEYTVYDADSSKFGSQFAAAVATLLAARIAGGLTQDGGQRMGQLMQLYYNTTLPKARRFDGSQGKPPVYTAFLESRWVRAHV
jgi:hypothetical protein